MGEKKMKKYSKVLSLALAFVMLFALCACGAAETPASEAPAETEAPAESQGVLDQIKADGVLYVTLSPDFAPMEFVDSSKDGQEQYVGFDVTLAKYIANYIGVDLVIEPMSFDACQTAVYTGSVPMSISGYSWTEERGENYEISDYYYAGDNETEQVILIKKTDADKYTSAEDFSGVDVGAQNASLQMNLLTSQLPDANPITIGDLGVGVLELQNRCYRELSGGQQQRVLLARALCAADRLLILDEPVTGLDPAATQDLYKTLRYLNEKEKMAVIMVTHDMRGALREARTILHIGRDGWFFGTVAEYLASPAGKRFGGAL